MGMVPVAPNSKRMLFEGERKVKGFIDRFVEVKLNRMEIANRTIFARIIDLKM